MHKCEQKNERKRMWQFGHKLFRFRIVLFEFKANETISSEIDQNFDQMLSVAAQCPAEIQYIHDPGDETSFDMNFRKKHKTSSAFFGFFNSLIIVARRFVIFFFCTASDHSNSNFIITFFEFKLNVFVFACDCVCVWYVNVSSLDH